MIQAKELRIGNWIQRQYRYKDSPQRDHDDYVQVQEVSNRWLSMSCGAPHPIPLTEGILLKCGFEKRVDTICNESHFALGKFIVSDDFILCDIDIHIVITTLHQLQNLYFALTGEELNIEL